MKIRNNISSVNPNNITFPKKTSTLFGKVYYSVTNPEDFDNMYPIGTVFYLKYPECKNIYNVELKSCNIALPINPNIKIIPLREELIHLIEGPSYETQDNNLKSVKYYDHPINLWSNKHHNSQPGKNKILGKFFEEDENVGDINISEGDVIFEGRFNNYLKFGSTSKNNTWSEFGKSYDPIIVINNGYKYKKDIRSTFYENIDSDNSSIYLTSSQKIKISDNNIDPVIPIIPLNLFISPQIILSSDRIVLNSKKNDIILNSQQTLINSNNTFICSNNIFLKSDKIFIGNVLDNQIPNNPVLLGNNTLDLISNLLYELKNFSSKLENIISCPEGTPILSLGIAAKELTQSINNIIKTSNNLDNLKSKIVFIN